MDDPKSQNLRITETSIPDNYLHITQKGICAWSLETLMRSQAYLSSMEYDPVSKKIVDQMMKTNQIMPLEPNKDVTVIDKDPSTDAVKIRYKDSDIGTEIWTKESFLEKRDP